MRLFGKFIFASICVCLCVSSYSFSHGKPPQAFVFPLCSEERLASMHTSPKDREADIKDVSLVAPILEFIESAKGNLRGCVYKLDHPLILQALKNKAKQISVQLFVESTPFQHQGSDQATTNIVDLKTHGVQVFEKLPEYPSSQLHAKFLVDDERVLVTTQNWDVESFVGALGWRNAEPSGDAPTRDVLFIFDDKKLAQEVTKKFDSFVHPDGKRSPGSFFVFGPQDNTRNFIEMALKSAKKSVQIDQQSMQDKGIVETLQSLLTSGKAVEIVMSEDPFHKGLKGKTDETGNLEKLVALGAKISLIPTFTFPYVHQKTVIIDGKHLLFTTSNFYKPSLDEGFEISFLLDNEEVTQNLVRIFRSDYRKGILMKS